MEKITGESYDPKEMAGWGLEHELKMAIEVLGLKKVKNIIKKEIK